MGRDVKGLTTQGTVDAVSGKFLCFSPAGDLGVHSGGLGQDGEGYKGGVRY